MHHGERLVPGISSQLERSLHRALALANERKHEYATLEHLVLALTEDIDAIAVLNACNVKSEILRTELSNYLEDQDSQLALEEFEEARPTASFQRVIQRALIHVQSSGREEVTGANILVSVLALGYSCSNVTGNLSKNASFIILVPIRFLNLL